MKTTHPLPRAKAALALLIIAASVFAPLSVQAQTPATDAPLPANQTLTWGAETVTQTSPTRGQFSLNGLWRFIPALGDAARDPQSGWGYIRVPGNWKNNSDLVARGTGPMWQSYDGNKLAQAWYERKITIPQNWDGRAVLLDLRRVSTDATVFVDGKEAEQVNWPGGTIDLTGQVRAGATHTLRLRVIATDDRAQVANYMGYLETEMKPAVLDNKGVIGAVNLLSRPRSAHVRDLLVRPSTRQKKLNVDVELSGVQQAGNVQLTARLLDEKGAVEKTFTQTLPVQAAPTQSVTASWDWANPRLWDYGQPNMYTLQLSVKGAGLDDEYSQPFGFREFWIEGNQFYLNNTLFHIRPIVAGMMLKQRMDQGFNLMEIWPNDHTRRGSNHNDDELIAQADKVGMPLAGNLTHMSDTVNLANWAKPERRADYMRQMEMEVRRWRNNPSIVMWATSGNALGNSGSDSDPWTLGLPPTFVQENINLRQRVREVFTWVRTLDPQRPIFGHHSDNGEVTTSNMYLNFIPLQEREEWLSHWAQNKSLPWMAVEMGTPLYSSLMRGRDGYGPQGHSEPHLTEWTSVYLGREAYALEPADYRTKVLRDRFKGGDLQKEYDPHIRNDGHDRTLSESPAYSKLLDLFFVNTHRTWRTMGMSGGIIPWHHDQHPALQRVNGPSLAWIAGPGGRPDQSNADKPVFTEKDHSFRAGQKVDKQIVLINDFRAPQNYSYTWQANIGGRKVAGATKTGRLAVGQIAFVPLSFSAPAAFTGGKASGEIKLAAKIGTQQHNDTFAFRVFKPAPVSKGVVSVFDPVGETTAFLKGLGYTVQPWKGGAVAGGTLVIGRKVLSNKNVLPASIQGFVQNGGRLLVMAQEPRWMDYALGLRTAPHVARRVYRIDTKHPAVNDLDDTDLQDWNGTSKLTQAYPRHAGYDWTPAFGWKWGNRGGVSSAPLEKPHRTSWRPILETEFDMAYSPLMEMEVGKGRITLCTLDLEDHAGIDPAANTLAKQLLQYVRTAPIAAKANRVIYIGGDSGAKTLDNLGVNYTRATAIDGAAQLIIIGEGAGINDADLRGFATKGGKILVLPQKAATLGAQVKQSQDFNGSLSIPSWPEARGLSVSDLNIKGNFDMWLVSGGEGVEIGGDGMLARHKIGKGVVVWSQMGPDVLPADALRYYRFSRWRQTRALSQILSNLGATFKQDTRLVQMLQQPPHAWMLAGPWAAQLTVSRKESPTRQWQPDPGISELAKSLIAVDAPKAGWEKVHLPGYMESFGPKWRFVDGEVVYRKEFNVPAYMAGKDLFFAIGRVDETEETFFNGQFVAKSKSWIQSRGHRIPGNLVKAGKNVLAVRTWDEGIHGGIMGDPHYFSLRVADNDPDFYHDDYISDDIDEGEDEKVWAARGERWKIADNPYRYYRW
jgi:beta-galactosidase